MEILTNVYVHAVALSALAVVALHQILKLKFIPWGFFNRYPVPGLIILSVLSALVVSLKTPVQPQTAGDWFVLVGTIAATAGLTYLATLKNWSELRATEGAK